MIQVLVTIAVVVVVLFILVLLICLMVWVVTKLLRFLFPQRFASAAAGPKPPKGKKKKKSAASDSLEYRCGICADLDSCPAACTGVAFPCRHYKARPEVAEILRGTDQ